MTGCCSRRSDDSGERRHTPRQQPEAQTEAVPRSDPDAAQLLFASPPDPSMLPAPSWVQVTDRKDTDGNPSHGMDTVSSLLHVTPRSQLRSLEHQQEGHSDRETVRQAVPANQSAVTRTELVGTAVAHLLPCICEQLQG